MVRYKKELLKKNQETTLDAEIRRQAEAFEKEKEKNRRDALAVKSTENRDLWIGHKLGNVITDTKIGGNQAQTEAVLVQNGKLVFSLQLLICADTIFDCSFP